MIALIDFMSTMKILPTFLLTSALVTVLTSCPAPTSTPEPVPATTADLSITVTGVPNAPVKVINSAGEVKFNDTVTGSKTLSALPKDKYTVTGAGVANFVAPAPVTADLSAGNGSATLNYTAQAGQALALDKIQGTLSDPLAKGNRLGVFLSNSILASGVIGNDGSVIVPLAAPPASELSSFLPSAGSVCSYSGTGSGSGGKVFFASDLAIYNTQGDVFGEVTEVPVGKTAALLSHVYADKAQAYQGTIACTSPTATYAYQLNIQLAAGWNALIQENLSDTSATLTTAPAATRVQLDFKKLPGAVNIFLDSPAISLRSGESVSVNATLYQLGGVTGKLDLTTDVPGVTVEPASVTLPALGTQSARPTSIFERLVPAAHSLRLLNIGTQSLKTVLTFKAAADASSFSGTMNVVASQGGKPLGQVGVGLSLVAPGVTASIVGANGVTELAQNETAVVPIQVESFNGFSGPVTIGLSGLPAGVSAVPQTVQVVPTATTTASLQLSAAVTATLGNTSIQLTANKPISASSVIGTTLLVLPARTRVDGAITGIYPATTGVWVVGQSTFGGSNQNLPIYYYPVTRYVNGVAQVSIKIEGNVSFASSLSGDLIAVVSNYDSNLGKSSYVTRKIHDDGTYQDVPVVQNFSVSPRKFVSDAQNRLLFIDIDANTYAGLMKRINSDGSVVTIDNKHVYASYANIQTSNDKKFIIAKSKNISGSSFVVNIDPATDVVTELNSGVIDSYTFSVGNNGDVYGTVASNLQKYNSDGTTTTFNFVPAAEMIGFDQKNPNILWVSRYDGVSKINTDTHQGIDTLINGNVDDRHSARLLNGGIVTTYSVYDGNSGKYTSYFSELK